MDYEVREKSFVEALLDIELCDVNKNGTLYNGMLTVLIIFDLLMRNIKMNLGVCFCLSKVIYWKEISEIFNWTSIDCKLELLKTGYTILFKMSFS